MYITFQNFITKTIENIEHLNRRLKTNDSFHRFQNQHEDEKEMKSGVKMNNIGVYKVRTSGTCLPIYLPDILGELGETEEDRLRDTQNMDYFRIVLTHMYDTCGN
ncbi:hypothetical protein V1478_008419 [Vespula squamosa]|uniref:Uncharacterized protein n=1 Tax=Vespula squamosa TaxID=30214 RepID=A0ABD2AU32_VESSQ